MIPLLKSSNALTDEQTVRVLLLLPCYTEMKLRNHKPKITALLNTIESIAMVLPTESLHKILNALDSVLGFYKPSNSQKKDYRLIHSLISLYLQKYHPTEQEQKNFKKNLPRLLKLIDNALKAPPLEVDSPAQKEKRALLTPLRDQIAKLNESTAQPTSFFASQIKSSDSTSADKIPPACTRSAHATP